MKHTQHTALATLTLALLTLTSCTNPNNTNNIPTPDTSTTASSGHIPTPDPTTSSETNYSGGSKAPTGEYRPADEHGPAQNVPRPTRPEGMNIESKEGLEKFITYWNETRNYTIQTGDALPLQSLYSETYEAEAQFIDSVEALYQNKGWIIGLTRKIHLSPDLLISHGDGVYSWGLNIESENGIINEVDSITTIDSTEDNQQGYEFFFKYKNGEWKAIDGVVVS